MKNHLREKFINKFIEARDRTLQIFNLANEDALHKSPGFGFRPILWHLAHIGAFEEYWILQKANNANALNEQFQIIFDPIKTPRENSDELPTKAEMLRYLEAVRENAVRVLDNFDFSSDDPLFRAGYVFDLVHQHELQHQETLAYLFQLLPLENLQNAEINVQSLFDVRRAKHEPQTIEFADGNFMIGAVDGDFAYDNELPAFEKFVPAFELDRFLTTNAEFAEFIAARGYERPKFWSEEGWQFRAKENLNAPLYWRKTGDNEWRIRSMFAENSLTEVADVPVCGVSFYEAEAYARFCGKRLPTEFEWERAASQNDVLNENKRFAIKNASPENCNFGFHFWQATPVNNFGDDDKSIADLNGNLWEWTSSDFAPYPNFRAFPYEDYSEKWFDGNHKVLKGGSFATSKEILRTSFRNFFRKNFRIAFAGIRLASDV